MFLGHGPAKAEAAAVAPVAAAVGRAAVSRNGAAAVSRNGAARSRAAAGRPAWPPGRCSEVLAPALRCLDVPNFPLFWFTYLLSL